MPDEKLSNAKALRKCNYESNYWNILPDKLLEKILLYASERSGDTLPDHKSKTCDSILQMCHRFKMIESSGKSILPHKFTSN